MKIEPLMMLQFRPKRVPQGNFRFQTVSSIFLEFESAQVSQVVLIFLEGSTLNFRGLRFGCRSMSFYQSILKFESVLIINLNNYHNYYKI